MKKILSISFALCFIAGGCFLRDTTPLPPDVPRSVYEDEQKKQAEPKAETVAGATATNPKESSANSFRQTDGASITLQEQKDLSHTTTPEDIEIAASEQASPPPKVDKIVSATIPLARYESYSAAKIKSYLGKNPLAIFFYSDQNPACKLLDEKLKSGITALPPDSVILKADFDAETDLKNEFEIAEGSTIVFLDAAGMTDHIQQNPTFEDIYRFFSAP